MCWHTCVINYLGAFETRRNSSIANINMYGTVVNGDIFVEYSGIGLPGDGIYILTHCATTMRGARLFFSLSDHGKTHL